MSLYDDDRYNWRETYFVLFQPERRPRTKDVRRQLEAHAGTFRILDQQTGRDGALHSLTIASYEDHAALEIVYREGDEVQAEIRALAETLEKGGSPEEIRRLRKARTCRAKFDILHFEQTAGTAAFKIVKMPEIRFAPKEGTKNGLSNRYRHRDSFPNVRPSDKLGETFHDGQTPEKQARFHFDPNSYEHCRNDGAGAELDEPVGDEDSGILERIDPNTLVLVLEVLCRASDGIAIDPASGVVI